jgi:hypothetical protein
VGKENSRRKLHTVYSADEGESVAPWISFWFSFFYVSRTTCGKVSNVAKSIESAFCLLVPY